VLRHIALVCERQERPIGPLRRIISWYFKDTPGVKSFRDAINHAQTVEEMRALLDAFVPDEASHPAPPPA